MKAPAGLKRGGRGRKLWDAVTATHDFDPFEAALLEEACGVLDQLDALPADAIAERRQQRVLFSRYAAQLSLPDPNGAARIPAGTSVRGRAAAEARWRRGA